MKKVLVILFVIIGILLMVGARYLQVQYAAPFVPKPTSFTLTPPPSTLTGIITSIIGNAEKMGRDSTEYQEASPSARLLQGESITTKGYSQIVLEFSKTLNVTMESLAEIDLVNMLPDNLTFRQKSGRITYELTKDEFPLSVRVLQTLINITSGESIIEIHGTTLVLSVISGTLQTACIDLDNNTQELSLSEGQTRYLNQNTCL